VGVTVPRSLFPVPYDVLDGITSLVEKNLVQLYDSPDGGTRYRLLEMIREYGLEKLVLSGEEERGRTAHAETYLAIAERGEKELNGPNHAEWVARLKVEQDNIRAALDWSISAGHAERSLRFGSALWRFWAATGRVQEGGAFLERAIKLNGPLPPGLRSKTLRRLGNLAVERADYRIARAHFTASLATARDERDDLAAAQALGSLGFVSFNLGDYEHAKAALEEALTFVSDPTNDRDRAVVFQLLGFVAFARAQFDEAEHFHNASLRLRRKLDDTMGAAYSAVWLGQLARLNERWEEARNWLDHALAVFLQGGDQPGMGHALFELALLNRAIGNSVEAMQLVRQSLELRLDVRDVQYIVESIEGVALLIWDSTAADEGVKLFAAATAWRVDQGVVRHPPIQRDFDEAISLLRAAIGDIRFETAWRIGETTTLDQTSAQALLLVEQ
jgi:tetratricopeptide (TPR) repeat protein